MLYKSTVRFVCAVAALIFSGSVAFGQQTTQLPKQNPFLKPTKSLSTSAGTSLTSNATTSSQGGPQLTVFNYSVNSSRDGNTYTGTIVGVSPFNKLPPGTTKVSTQIIPTIIVTHSVFAGVDTNGNVLTKNGVTTFDPTVPDTSCLTPPNDVPLTLTQQSPIFQPADFNYGGTDVGFTQATDAFQRANFFQLVNPENPYVLLEPVTTLSPIFINIQKDSGVAYPSAAFGGCPGGNEAIIDIAVYEPAIIKAIAAASKQVNPSTLPIFIIHNVVQCEGPAGANCGTLGPTSLCCILGFHDSNGPQTLASADFDTSNIFVSPTPDIAGLSHEIGEWMNDPFGNNPTPAWGHTGQVAGCQNNLEVGDPLSGSFAPPIFMSSNGFTYHPQELAFFSWFYGAPSVGIHGWFSNNATFLHDAGPVCQ